MLNAPGKSKQLGGGGKYLLFWANGGNGSGSDPCNMGAEIAASEVTEILDEHRRRNWALAQEPDRPKPFGNRVMISEGMHGGPGKEDREALFKDAKARAAKAQLMWEEAVRDQVKAMAAEPIAADANASPAKGEESDEPGQPASGSPEDRTDVTDSLRDGPPDSTEGKESPHP